MKKTTNVFLPFLLCSGFAITCATDGSLYGYPGSTIDVTIPAPTVIGGVSVVTFTYNWNTGGNSQQPLSNPYRAAVPMSGTTWLSFTVLASVSNVQRTCTYTTSVTGQLVFVLVFLSRQSSLMHALMNLAHNFALQTVGFMLQVCMKKMC